MIREANFKCYVNFQKHPFLLYSWKQIVWRSGKEFFYCSHTNPKQPLNICNIFFSCKKAMQRTASQSNRPITVTRPLKIAMPIKGHPVALLSLLGRLPGFCPFATAFGLAWKQLGCQKCIFLTALKANREKLAMRVTECDCCKQAVGMLSVNIKPVKYLYCVYKNNALL